MSSRPNFKKKRGLRTEVEGFVKQYEHKGVAVRKLLTWADIQPSSYYYKKSGLRKGRKPTTHSVNQDGELFKNAVVVKDIEATLAQEFAVTVIII